MILFRYFNYFFYVVVFILCDSLASEFYVPKFRNILSVPLSYVV